MAKALQINASDNIAVVLADVKADEADREELRKILTRTGFPPQAKV
jgi:arsenate reductase-like glutaredoxin family protein